MAHNGDKSMRIAVLAGHAAREDRILSNYRHPAPLTGDAPTRDSGRGPATRCVPQISCGADS